MNTPSPPQMTKSVYGILDASIFLKNSAIDLSDFVWWYSYSIPVNSSIGNRIVSNILTAAFLPLNGFTNTKIFRGLLSLEYMLKLPMDLFALLKSSSFLKLKLSVLIWLSLKMADMISDCL